MADSSQFTRRLRHVFNMINMRIDLSNFGGSPLRLIKAVVPIVAFPIFFFAQAGSDSAPPMMRFLVIGMVVLTVGGVLMRLKVKRRGDRSGRVDEICDDVAERGSDIADDILANRATDL